METDETAVRGTTITLVGRRLARAKLLLAGAILLAVLLMWAGVAHAQGCSPG